jgi:hypothetical protein
MCSSIAHRHLFHSKNICPLLFLTRQGKRLPFTPSLLRLNIFRLFVILSLTQLYRYSPEIFLFSTATFKYKYRAPSGIYFFNETSVCGIATFLSAECCFSGGNTITIKQNVLVKYKADIIIIVLICNLFSP